METFQTTITSCILLGGMGQTLADRGCETALEARGGDDVGRTVSPCYASVNGWPIELAPLIGAVIAVIVASQYGRPSHAIVTFWVMAVTTGLAFNLGLHRLFSHHSFATFRPVECVLMILGSTASTRSPFYWIATHRVHHRHSDRDGDPHSPHIFAGRPLGLLRGFWHAHWGWLHSDGYAYPMAVVRDLSRRRDLAWIDRYWFLWCLIGLAIPGIVGFVIGGTAYDALIGFLWGGLFRHFVVLQMQFAVGSVCHLWGARPYDTADQSRNNFLLGLIALGEGWHNNHHAMPSSARHGFHWWQLDLTWCVIRLMERVGLAWDVRRPNPVRYRETIREEVET
jgi:stearoyl-CoA desaturase (delta-9 desaturase)